MEHKKYIERCLQLAKLGWPACRPNPMVGCVIVHDGKIISEGFHKSFGKEHAEVMAINRVQDKSLLRESTIYVSLEPCSHHGKTPPCSDLILSHNPQKVIIGNLDPNPIVAGTGVKKLKDAGISVEVVNLQEGEKLNARFFTYYTCKRPYIILKWAESIDGYIAPETNISKKSYWISGLQSRQFAHQWRAEEMAILVGVNTIISDNPSLSTRLVKGPNPLRVVLDPHNRLQENTNVLLDNSPVLIFNHEKNLKIENKEWIQAKSENMINEVLDNLSKRNIQSLIVEGGTKTIQGFIELGKWDEIRRFICPAHLGAGLSSPTFDIEITSSHQISEDNLQFYFNPSSPYSLHENIAFQLTQSGNGNTDLGLGSF